MNKIKNQNRIFPEDGIQLHIVDGRLSYCGTYSPLPITLAKIQLFSRKSLYASSDYGELYLWLGEESKASFVDCTKEPEIIWRNDDGESNDAALLTYFQLENYEYLAFSSVKQNIRLLLSEIEEDDGSKNPQKFASGLQNTYILLSKLLSEKYTDATLTFAYFSPKEINNYESFQKPQEPWRSHRIY